MNEVEVGYEVGMKVKVSIKVRIAARSAAWHCSSELRQDFYYGQKSGFSAIHRSVRAYTLR